MNYCENCGFKLKEGSVFCENCGLKLQQLPIIEKSNKKSNGKRVKRLTTVQKIMFAILLLLIAVGIFGYNFGKTVYSEENQINQILETIEKKDADQLADILFTYDANFEVTGENLQGLTEYFDRHPEYLTQLTNGLKDERKYDAFSIQKYGEIFGLYDSYELVLEPVYGQIYTNVKDAVIILNGQEIMTADTDDFTMEIGPVAPGTLSFEVHGEVNNFSLSTTQTTDWLHSNQENEVDLSLTGYIFSVESELQDATVYLNNEEIGALEGMTGNFGPLQWEPDMELHLETMIGNESVKSEVVLLEEDTASYSFNNVLLAGEEDVKELLSNMYLQITYASRFGPEDLVLIEDFFYPESPAYNEQLGYFIDFAESLYQDSDSNRVEFNVSINDVERVGKGTFEVNYEVTYTTIYNHGHDERHYSKDATVVFEESTDSSKDFESWIYEIRNESLVYEEDFVDKF